MYAKLSVARVRSLKAPGRYADGNTLYLHIALGGSKQWVQRLTINGKRHDIGLGGFPLVNLAEARKAAWESRRLARAGGDPLAENRKTRLRASMPTFRAAAEKIYAALRPRWRSDKVAVNWMQQLERNAMASVLEVLQGNRRAGKGLSGRLQRDSVGALREAGKFRLRTRMEIGRIPARTAQAARRYAQTARR